MRVITSARHKLQHLLRLERTVRFVWQCGPGWFIASLALLFVQGTLPLAVLYLLKLLVDAIAAAAGSPEPLAAFPRVALLVGLSALAALLTQLAQQAAGLVNEGQSQAVADRMHEQIHRQSTALDLAYYDNPRYFDTLHRAQQEAPYRPQRILAGLVGSGQNLITLTAMAGLLAVFHWSAALALLTAALPGWWIKMRHSRSLYRWQSERSGAERRAGYYDYMLTDRSHAKEVRLFGLGELFRGRFGGLRRMLRRERLQLALRRTGGEALATGFGVAAAFAAVGFIAWRTVTGAISLGDMVMFIQALQRGLAAWRDMLGGLASLYEDSLFLQSVHEFLNLKPSQPEPSQPKPAPAQLIKGIRFEGVAFRYPESSRPILENLNLDIGAGEVVALVGENGSGKSTLVKLLCRLYDPEAGRITLDGVDLREFAAADLRQAVGVVFQDYVPYFLPARENIWFGDIRLAADSDRIQQAAEAAGAAPRILKLPQGYDTVLGRWFEEGEELSTGEWQKVALARAFIRECPILVLDEPFSAADPRAESELCGRFRALIGNRTAIIVSHRLSTVAIADRIALLSGGRVSELGSHQELLRAGGDYARLYRLQN